MGWGVPSWAERDLRRYLRGGILAHGFARVRGGDWGHERLGAFSCKGRGVCPSCNTRRMGEVAAHLTDHVLVLGGVFSEGEEGVVRFHEASKLTAKHWEDRQGIVRRRVLRDHVS